MTEFSRRIGTEAAFLDIQAQGAGFLVVHCGSEVRAEKIRAVVAPFEPMSVQWYRGGAIRVLV